MAKAAKKAVVVNGGASGVNRTLMVACTGATVVDWHELVPMQGDLKSLSKENYTRLRRALERGFSFPFFVWRNGGKYFTLDGHQRLRALETMEGEGWIIPPLPVAWVEARDRREAMRKILECSSQYGTMEEEGLYEYVATADIRNLDDYNFDKIDLKKFAAGYLAVDEPGPGDGPGIPGGTTCPKCGYIFKEGN